MSAPEQNSPPQPPAVPRLKTFHLEPTAHGAIETINNIVNMTVVSKDVQDLKAEYHAGFVQGRLQGKLIFSARDNSWDNAYLTDPEHTFPRQLGPTPLERDKARDILLKNYNSFIDYVRTTRLTTVAWRLKRLLFRLLGIYHGATLDQPAALDFSGNWLPTPDSFSEEELQLGYESTALTFMDVYFLNAFNDLMDAISSSPELCPNGIRKGDFPDKCSAFLKRVGDEIILAHNSWMGFLSQTMNQTLAVNGDWVTMNAATPGLIGSGTDFGYNNKGILFTETTHRFSCNHPKVPGVWIFWRAALAEQFADSVRQFFEYLSINNTGTYLNGYMVVDANTKETGLIEMSYRSFVYFSSTEIKEGTYGEYDVKGFNLEGDCSKAYQKDMVTPGYLMGINYPASDQVRQDLASQDNRPARRQQFQTYLPKVEDLEDAKKLITYVDDPGNPLSIFGRWDLGYGQTDFPKRIPDGSVDAKVASTKLVREFMNLSGVFDPASPVKGYPMLFGTPVISGKPFIWSESPWADQKLRDVPDVLDGSFTRLPLYMK